MALYSISAILAELLAQERPVIRLLCIHPENPQARLVKQVVEILKQGGVAILPTDSGYSLCCPLGEKEPLERIRRIRNLEDKHFFTVLCRDLAEAAVYGHINNPAFRFLKAHIPAPLTFILSATKEVPKRLLHPRRKTVGIRIPQSPSMMAILHAFSAPLMSVSVDEFEKTWPLLDPEEIFSKYHKQIDIMVSVGTMTATHTTVIDLINGIPTVI